MIGDNRSDYREYRPPPALANRIICFWTQETFGTSIYLQSVLPDGCMDIVWIGQRAPILVGPATRTLIAKLPGETNIVGVRFLPGCASPTFGGLPVDQMVNQEIPLGDTWKFGADILTDQLLQSEGIPEELDTIANGLSTLIESAPVIDPLIRFCTNWLTRHTASRIRDLAGAIGLSERQLLRRFCSEVGYSPKTFQRIMRLQRLLAFSSCTREPATNLATLALELGYSDQAHMCREAKSLAGISPLSLLQNDTEYAMSDLFNTDKPTDGYSLL